MLKATPAPPEQAHMHTKKERFYLLTVTSFINRVPGVIFLTIGAEAIKIGIIISWITLIIYSLPR